MTLNFETICRTCMSKSQALMSIFDEKNSSENDVLSLLQSTTSIRALKDDGLPQNICIDCLAEMNRAFTFKNRSERSEKSFRQYLSRLNSESNLELESKTATNSTVLSVTTDDQGHEIVEVDDNEQSMLRTELVEHYKSETDNGESSSNVVYERHINDKGKEDDGFATNKERMKRENRKSDSEAPVGEEKTKRRKDTVEDLEIPNSVQQKTRSCHVCGFVYRNTNPSTIKEHLRRHEGRVECEKCGKSLKKRSLRVHIKKCSSVEGNFSVCTICGKSLASMIFLRRHNKIFHPSP